jgi:hypothetical protein
MAVHAGAYEPVSTHAMRNNSEKYSVKRTFWERETGLRDGIFNFVRSLRRKINRHRNNEKSRPNSAIFRCISATPERR